MIRAVTYNCQRLKSSIYDVQALCSSYDLIFILESWLFQYELLVLSRIDSEFEGFGLSAIDDTTNIVQGMPYGGMAILIRKKYCSMVQFHTNQFSRLLEVELTCNNVSMLFISVYMPYQCKDKDLTDYKYLTRIYCKDIHVDDVVKCSDVNCNSHDHLKQIDDLYSQLCSVLKHASYDSIPTSKLHTHHDYIVPGFNKFAKQLRSEARADYLLWKASGKPRAGLLYLICVNLGLDLSVH